MKVIIEIFDGHSAEGSNRIYEAAKLFDFEYKGLSDYNTDQGYKMIFEREAISKDEWAGKYKYVLKTIEKYRYK